MIKHIRRNCLRNHNKAPITYSKCDSDKYYLAQMHNRSVTGMYFESKHAVEPETEIYIRLENSSSDLYHAEANNFYRAKVKWCKEITDGDNLSYGIGVQYLPKTDLSFGAESPTWSKINIYDFKD